MPSGHYRTKYQAMYLSRTLVRCERLISPQMVLAFLKYLGTFLVRASRHLRTYQLIAQRLWVGAQCYCRAARSDPPSLTRD